MGINNYSISSTWNFRNWKVILTTGSWNENKMHLICEFWLERYQSHPYDIKVVHTRCFIGECDSPSVFSTYGRRCLACGAYFRINGSGNCATGSCVHLHLRSAINKPVEFLFQWSRCVWLVHVYTVRILSPYYNNP